MRWRVESFHGIISPFKIIHDFFYSVVILPLCIAISLLHVHLSMLNTKTHGSCLFKLSHSLSLQPLSFLEYRFVSFVELMSMRIHIVVSVVFNVTLKRFHLCVTCCNFTNTHCTHVHGIKHAEHRSREETEQKYVALTMNGFHSPNKFSSDKVFTFSWLTIYFRSKVFIVFEKWYKKQQPKPTQMSESITLW